MEKMGFSPDKVCPQPTNAWEAILLMLSRIDYRKIFILTAWGIMLLCLVLSALALLGYVLQAGFWAALPSVGQWLVMLAFPTLAWADGTEEYLLPIAAITVFSALAF